MCHHCQNEDCHHEKPPQSWGWDSAANGSSMGPNPVRDLLYVPQPYWLTWDGFRTRSGLPSPFVITLVTRLRRCKAVVATLWHLPLLLLILCYTYKKWLPTGLVCHLLPRVESSAPLNNTEQCGQLQQMNNLFIKQREFYFLVASDIS